MSKVEIRTELLEQLNKGIAGKTESFTIINKASTEEKATDVKPLEIVGESFNAKDWVGDPTEESETTIAGCFNTIVREMAAFVEGVILVDQEAPEEPEEEEEEKPHYSGPYYTPPVETPTEEPTTEEPTTEEPPEEEEEEEEGEEVTVTPVVIDPATLAGEFSTGGEGTTTTNDGIGTITVIQDGAIITDANGNQVGTTSMGQYKVYEQMSDENGNVIAVRISPDGEVEQWIRINQNGSPVGTFYETNQVGSFSCNSDNIVIFDKNNNPIGTLSQGYHKVYAITTDNNGNVTAIRISKDGEEEQWIQIYENGKYIDGGTFEQYGQQYSNPQTVTVNETTTATVYGKRNKILGGVLGVLVVGLGATIYVKKKKESEGGSESYEEEALPEGDYDIYDYNTDDDGNITEAKISSDGSPEEQWVEF